ncbi:MAG TPA: hypothetical protein DGB32_05230 [Dehalococcoidia bacterium]|nr:hypothetical protein [Chloroflexota bacterium]HCV27706.1 hypothetical protein [Dehalococcoidia bacterium]
MDEVSTTTEYNYTSFPLDMDMPSFEGFAKGRLRITPYTIEWQPNRETPVVEFVGGLYDVPGERAVEEFIAVHRATNGEEVATMVQRAAGQALRLRQSAPAGHD